MKGINIQSIKNIIQEVSKKNKLRGYINIYDDKSVNGYLQGTNIAIDDIIKTLNKYNFIIVNNNEYSFNQFFKLDFFEKTISDKFIYKEQVYSYEALENISFAHLDNPNSKGEITGYCFGDKNLKALPFSLYIDNELIESETQLFDFRVLKQGHPTGNVGFKANIPSQYMDGKKHIFSLVTHSQYKNIGRNELLINIIFYKDLTKKWQISHNKYSLYAKLKHQLTYGNFEEAKEKIIKLIDDNPSYIFKDLGFIEKYKNEKKYFFNFRDRLSDRSYLWHSNTECNSTHCCKKSGLNLNTIHASALKHFGTDNPNIIRQSCAHWPRYFASKIFIKKYAKKFNLKTPKTLAVLNTINELNNYNIPSRCVIKPESTSGKGLFLMHDNINLFNGIYTSDADIKKELGLFVKDGQKILVEEFLVQEGMTKEDPIIPLDYKIHVFGGKVRLIHVDDKNNLSRDKLRRYQGWFARDWTPSPQRFRPEEVEFLNFKKPENYNELIKVCDAIAKDFNNDYLRIDIYATNNGFYIGEFSHTSHNGVGFTEFGDLVLSQLWELFPGPMQHNKVWS